MGFGDWGNTRTDDPSLLKKAYTAYENYPRALTAEATQKFLETREAFEDRGFFSGVGHALREATGVTAWDPSEETDLGREVAQAIERFRSERGRDPNIVESYDIKAEAQDKIAPFLTKRYKVGPIDASLRGWMEAPVTLGTALAEGALTFGAAAVGRGAAMAGAKGARALSASGMGTAASGLRTGSAGVGLALRLPKMAEDAVGKVIGAGLRHGVARPVKYGNSKARLAINRFQKRALDEGAPFEEVKKVSDDQWQKEKTSVVEDILGRPVRRTLAGGMETGMFGPQPGSRGWSNMETLSDEAIGNAPEGASPTANSTYHLFRTHHTQEESNRALSEAFGYQSNTGSKMMDARYFIEDSVLPALSEGAQGIKNALKRTPIKNVPFISNMLQDTGKIITKTPRDMQELHRQGRDFVRMIKNWQEQWRGPRQGEIDTLLVHLGVIERSLVKAGILRVAPYSMVKKPKGTQNFTEGMEELFEENEFNFVFNDDALPDGMSWGGSEVTAASYKGDPNNLIKAGGRGKDAVMYDQSLSPGFADVMRRLPQYTSEIKAVPDVLFEATGTYRSLESLLNEYKTRLDMISETLQLSGYKFTNTARDLVKGGAFAPRNTINVALDSNGRLMYPNNPEWVARYNQNLTEPLWKGVDTFASQAEGIASGATYLSPAAAAKDLARMTLRAVENDEIAKAIKIFSKTRGINFKSIDEIIKATDSYPMLEGILRQAETMIGRMKHGVTRKTAQARAAEEAAAAAPPPTAAAQVVSRTPTIGRSITEKFKDGLNAGSVFEGGEVRPDTGYSWRSMGPNEYNSIIEGKPFGGTAQKGGFWSWFPRYSSNITGTPQRPKYLVEVEIPSEMESLTRRGTINDVRAVWKSTKKGVWEPEPFAPTAAPTTAAAQVGRTVAIGIARLPKELAGAKPRYNMGQYSYSPQFESDVDKALFIVSQPKKSASDESYMVWLRKEVPNLSDSELRQAGRNVRNHIKETLKGKPEGNVDIPTSSTVRDLGVRTLPTPTVAPSVARAAAGVGASREAIVDQLDKSVENIVNVLRYEPVALTDELASKTVDAHLKKLEKAITDAEKFIKSQIKEGPIKTKADRYFYNTQLPALRRMIKELPKTIGEMREDAAKGLRAFGEDARQSVQLEGYMFPEQFQAVVLNEVGLAKDLANNRGFSGTVETLNTFLRIFGATGDMSAFGIQGWLGVVNDSLKRTGALRLFPGGSAEMGLNKRGDSYTALVASMKGFGSDGGAAVDDMLYKSGKIAEENGLPGLQDAAAAGLNLQKGVAELSLQGATPLSKNLRNLPGLQRFERVFNSFGRIQRLNMFHNEVELLMSFEKLTWQQLRDRGDLSAIAESINFAMGIGKTRFAGDLGQFILFAPRFFHARMKVAMDGLAGMWPLPHTGKIGGGGWRDPSRSVQRRIARKYLTRMVGTGVFLTFALNEAQGEETDINPFLRNPKTGKWYYNSNFMKAKVGQLDISFFGPFDGLLRILAMPGVLAFNANAGLDPEQAWKDLRGVISAPITGVAADLITGEDAIGRKTNPFEEGGPGFHEVIMDHLTPFAWDELFFADPGKDSIMAKSFGGIREGDIGAVATGVSQVAMQALGVRSSYESTSETIDAAMAALIDLGPNDPVWQEIYGVTDGSMTMKEMQDAWAEAGGGAWNKYSNLNVGISARSLIFGTGTNKTPNFDSFASDIQQKALEVIRSGAVPDVMTSEELLTLEGKIDERLQRDASDYTEYSIERDSLINEEEAYLVDAEKAFLEGEDITFTYIDPDTGEETTETHKLASGDFGNYLRLLNSIRGNYSSRRRSLVGPEGKYEGVTDLFDFARKSALGNLSTYDSDIYDFAQGSLYEILYERTSMPDGTSLPSIQMAATAEIDWDLKERKVEIWETMMKERYPNLTPAQIDRYRLRIEEDHKRYAPPLGQMLSDMQDFISDQPVDPKNPELGSWYEVEEKIVQDFSQTTRQSEEEMLDTWKRWKAAGGNLKKDIEALPENRWLTRVHSLLSQRRSLLLRRNPQLEGILLFIEKRTAEPVTPRGRQVDRILSLHRRGIKPIENFTELAAAVYNGDDLNRFM